jgi:DNA-binding NarL/FixJ family response regulator
VLERGGMLVVGATRVPEQALAMVEEKAPDLLVADVDTSSDAMDGLSCLKEARVRAPGLTVVAMSQANEPDVVAAAFDAGAEAVVVKTAHPDDLAAAARNAVESSIYLPGHTAPQPRPEVQAGRVQADAGLTQREVEILQLAAEGRSNSELAGMLWVTEQTVKFHLSNIYRKLRVSNRTEASRWAQINGLLPQAPAEEEAKIAEGGATVSYLRTRS